MSLYYNMKAPGDIKPTWMGGVIQIHITRACDLSCTSCTQGSNLGGKPVMISLENFEIAARSLKDYHGVVGIFGGNPTMHPQFEAITDILAKWIPFERRGLWSNNLRGKGKLCREIFNPEVSNLNVHMSHAAYMEMKRDWPECHPIGLKDSRHSPPYVAMQDLNLTDAEIWELINHCDINQLWSAMICQVDGELFAYFCEIAGAQAMLHNDKSTGLPVTNDWWRQNISYFDRQIKKHCFACGVPLKGKGDLAVGGTTEYVSRTHVPIYKLKSKRELVVVENKAQLGGQVIRATDYINNGIQAKITEMK